MLTLARKLDNVHRNTVTSNNDIPNVLLATPAKPRRARNFLDLFAGICGDSERAPTEEAVSEAANSAASDRRRCSRSAAAMELADAIFKSFVAR